MSVLVLGAVAYDALETPFGKVDRIEGGSGMFSALAASYFTTPIHLLSVVGGDYRPEFLADFRQRGIATEGVEVRPQEKTFFWSGRYGHDLNSRTTLQTDLNVLADFSPTLPEAYRSAQYVMLANFSPIIQRQVLSQLHSRPKLVVMDTMNFWMDSMLNEVRATLAQVDVLTVNDEEARQLSGEYSLVKAAQKIMNLGPDYVIIKKGEHGALLFHRKEIFFAPALPLEEVFDPTGAGDSFAGGFLGYLASTKDLSFANLKSAVLYGSAMASFCVEKFGPQRLLELNSGLIRERLKAFLDLMSVDLQLV